MHVHPVEENNRSRIDKMTEGAWVILYSFSDELQLARVVLTSNDHYQGSQARLTRLFARFIILNELEHDQPSLY